MIQLFENLKLYLTERWGVSGMTGIFTSWMSIEFLDHFVKYATASAGLIIAFISIVTGIQRFFINKKQMRQLNETNNQINDHE